MNPPPKKNILLLIPTFADEGGTQKMVYELGILLSEKYTVYECSFDAFNEPHIFKTNNKVLSLESGAAKGVNKIFGYFNKAKRLTDLKKQYKIDVTISNLWAADLVNALSTYNDKKIAIGHVNIRGNFQNRILLRLRKFAGFIYNKFDKVVAVNQYLRDELQEVFRLKNNRATFINNFIAFAQHQPSIIAKPGKKRLVNFGRLNPIKNHKPLLKIFAGVKQQVPVQLVIVGAGPLHDELVSYAKELGLSVSTQPENDADVVFTGFHPDPYSVLCSSDIFVFSSQSEGFGLVLVEAMYAGLPIITSDCPTGGPHIILEGRGHYEAARTKAEETAYGYLMPVPHLDDENSLQQWNETILHLLNDDKKRKEQGIHSKKRAEDFSKENIKTEWFRLIDAL
jgi:glycosyltransferase involved in cell wall biosynthesis